jgi:hypothetical protein
MISWLRRGSFLGKLESSMTMSNSSISRLCVKLAAVVSQDFKWVVIGEG